MAEVSRRITKIEEALLNVQGTAEALQLLPGSDSHTIQVGPITCMAGLMADSLGQRIEELQELAELVHSAEARNV
jgi:hypothetical protein